MFGIGRQQVYCGTCRTTHVWTRVVFAVLSVTLQMTLVAVSIFVGAGIRSEIPPWVGANIGLTVAAWTVK
jgi:hypothetical protein